MKNIVCYILFFLCLGSVDSVFSATYYVDNKLGTDAFSGSEDEPFKTVFKAMKKVKPGDVVNIVSNGRNNPYTEPIEIVTSGQPGQVITVQGEPNKEKPVFEGNNLGSILKCYGKQFIVVKDIIFEKTKYSGLGFAKACNDIVLENLEIYDCKKNGILVNGGGKNFKILNCTIRQIGNSGIAFMGSEYSPLSDTTIEGCTISNVLTNDGITLHLDEHGNSLGSNHLIQKNLISYCNEQGIDITAGNNIRILDNLTFNNHDSGILLDHNVFDVKILNHESRDETLYSLIIGDSTNVLVKDSIFTGPVKNTVLLVRGCKDLLVEGNWFVSQSGSRDINIVDIAASENAPTNNLIFKNNKFVVGEGNFSTGMMLRYLGITPEFVNTVWIKNVWSNHQNKERVFYDKDNNIYSFDAFKSKFAPTDTFTIFVENIPGSL